MFFNWYLSNEKTAFVDKSRVEPTIFFIEKRSFSFKLFSGHFMGNPSLRLSEVLYILAPRCKEGSIQGP